MLIAYADGSFSLSWERARAWYSPQGELVDAEHKFPGRRTRAVRPSGPTWDWLKKQGRQYLTGQLAAILATKVSEAKLRLEQSLLMATRDCRG